MKLDVLFEVTNPYSVVWTAPTKEYMAAEAREIHAMRFSKNEFFHPDNYDTIYRIFPHLFSTIASMVNNQNVTDPVEVKRTLVGKDIADFTSGWEEWQPIMKHIEGCGKCLKEKMNLLSRGELVSWDNDKIRETGYLGKLTDVRSDTFKKSSSSRLVKQADETNDDYMKGYGYNLKTFRSERSRTLPAPFVIKYNAPVDGKTYQLLGGHKRAVTALQLRVPLMVWLIDVSRI